MSNRIFIDTLFVIALINQRDEHHKEASELAEGYENQPLLTTEAVLLEIGNALARNFKDQAVEVIDDFLTSNDVEIIHLTPELFDQGYSLYKKHQDKTWGLVDCISFEVLRKQKINSVLTFDRHFEQAGFQVLMRGTRQV